MAYIKIKSFFLLLHHGRPAQSALNLDAKGPVQSECLVVYSCHDGLTRLLIFAFSRLNEIAIKLYYDSSVFSRQLACPTIAIMRRATQFQLSRSFQVNLRWMFARIHLTKCSFSFFVSHSE